MKKIFLSLIVLFLASMNSKSYDIDLLNNIKNQISVDSLRFSIESLSGERKVKLTADSIYLPTRNSYYQEMDSARKWLFDKITGMGYTPEYHNFSKEIFSKFVKCKNIIFVKPPHSAENSYIVFSAHYDAITSSNGFYCPGADDNASGCAAVLEGARLLKDLDTKKGIIFALFDAEEYGLIGSDIFVNAKKHVFNIDFAINNDMLGFYKGDTTMIMSLAEANIEKEWQVLKFINQNLDIKQSFIRFNYPASDHVPFIKNKINSFTLTENKLNSGYHTINDKMNLIDTSYLKKNVALSIITLLALAEPYTLSISEEDKKQFLFVSPLPCKADCSISYYSEVTNFAEIVVTDYTGSLIFKTKIAQVLGLNKIDINTSNYPKGIYFFNIISDNTIKSGKLIKT